MHYRSVGRVLSGQKIARIPTVPGGDDRWLVAALQSGHPGAPTLLFDRYAQMVERVLTRVMGWDDELTDLLHEVFARALSGIGQLDDPARLGGWLASIAIYTARGCIRSRRLWRARNASGDLPEVADPSIDDDVREAMRRTYRVLDGMAADLRIPFALRYIDGMQLERIAELCDVSLATIKRRLVKAEKRFVKLARRDDVLARWLERGRWAAA